MKKILVFLISCFMPFVCSADYLYSDSVAGKGLKYKVTDAVKSAWGNPKINKTYIQDDNKDFGSFRIKQGWACCGKTTNSSTTITREDDVAIMALVARDITEHGAEFCLTQLSAWSSSSRFDLYHQQPRWPSLQCAWFCEPGWDGVGCMESSGPETACNTTDYRQRIDAVKASDVYSSRDAIALHQERMGVAEYTAVLDSAHVANRYWHEIVVGAVDFMEHGIVAKPILVGVVGEHLHTDLSTSGVVSGKTKVLCAQGFTADDKCNVSSKNCGKTLWCTGYSEDVYKSKATELEKVVNGYCTTYVCTGDKALSDDLKSCVACEVGPRTGRCDVLGNSLFGKCKRCAVGQYFNATTCECDTARAISKDKMQYGKYRSDVVTNQCWTKEDAKSYKECVTEGLE